MDRSESMGFIGIDMNINETCEWLIPLFVMYGGVVFSRYGRTYRVT